MPLKNSKLLIYEIKNVNVFCDLKEVYKVVATPHVGDAAAVSWELVFFFIKGKLLTSLSLVLESVFSFSFMKIKKSILFSRLLVECKEKFKGISVKLKGKLPRAGFELGLSNPFSKTITVTLRPFDGDNNCLSFPTLLSLLLFP